MGGVCVRKRERVGLSGSSRGTPSHVLRRLWSREATYAHAGPPRGPAESTTPAHQAAHLAASEAARSERRHRILCVCPGDAAEVLLGEVHQLPVLHPCRDRAVLLASLGLRHRVRRVAHKRRSPCPVLAGDSKGRHDLRTG